MIILGSARRRQAGAAARMDPYPAAVQTSHAFVYSGSQTLTMPAGIIAGDLLVAVLAISNNRSVTAFSGWTKVSDYSGYADVSIWVYKRTATGSESVTYPIALSVDGYMRAIVYSVRNANALVATFSRDSSTSIDPPSCTATAASDGEYLHINNIASTLTIANPSGWTSGWGTEFTYISNLTVPTSPSLASTCISGSQQTQDPGAVYLGASQNPVCTMLGFSQT